jgi:acyl carrier protein
MDTKAMLTGYIRSEIIHDQDAQFDESEDLIEAGALDSLGILQLVAYIDESMGIQVPDEDVIYENFRSLDAIDNYLQQYARRTRSAF